MATGDPVVVRDQDVLGGRPIFRGTRVQVETLFENLADGYCLDEIAYNFTTLDKNDLRAALMQACDALKASAPDVTERRRAERLARLPG